jgi:hypothetical protein
VYIKDKVLPRPKVPGLEDDRKTPLLQLPGDLLGLVAVVPVVADEEVLHECLRAETQLEKPGCMNWGGLGGL